jgi:uncharacterized protein
MHDRWIGSRDIGCWHVITGLRGFSLSAYSLSNFRAAPSPVDPVTIARSDRRQLRCSLTMANEGRTLDGLAAAAKSSVNQGFAPVHLWNPPDCGAIDMRIGADGTWYYQKTPIGRPALVKLFASVLKREGDRYFLVTPVEKCEITVDEAPFLAVELNVSGDGANRALRFRTNTDHWVDCGPDHPLRFDDEPGTGGLKPFLFVHADLWAKVTRALFYDLVELGEERMVDGRRMFGVCSNGGFFAMAPADAIEGLR